MIRLLAWLDRRASWVVLFALVCAAALFLSSCGTKRDTQTKTVERVTTVTGPVIMDTPIGQVLVQPVRYEMTRSEDAVETQQTRVVMPEASAIITAAAGATPWGGIITGIIGLGTAAFAGKKAIDASRQRNELIDGVERAKGKMDPTQADVLLQHLEAEQSADTKRSVKDRVG